MQISGIVVGFVIGLFGLVLFPVYVGFSDNLNRELQAHCTNGIATTLQVNSEQDWSGTTHALSVTSPTCNVGTLAVGTYFTEDGTSFNVTTADTAPTGWVGQGLPKVLSQFASVNQLLAQILPLMLAIGFLTTGFLAGSRMGMGSGMSEALGKEVLALVIAVIAIALMPTLIDFLTTAGDATGGQYLVTVRFGTITDLILSVIPTGATLSIIGITLRSGYKAYQQYRGGGSSFAGAM